MKREKMRSPRTKLTPTLLATVLLLGSCGGCGAESDTYRDCDSGGSFWVNTCYANWSPGFAVPEPTTCQVTLCLTGAINQKSGSNAAFHSICEYEELPGLVEDCEVEGCYTSFDSFLDRPQRTIYPEIFAALDTNGDEAVNDQDELCELNLITFSWGGPNAIRLAEMLAEDERISPTRRRVARLLMIEPYRPDTTLSLPENVDKARVWRQSASPDDDCSRYAPGGPYIGLPLVCPPDTDCEDIDLAMSAYSLQTTLDPVSFIEPPELGHCEVPLVARDQVMEALYDLENLNETGSLTVED